MRILCLLLVVLVPCSRMRSIDFIRMCLVKVVIWSEGRKLKYLDFEVAKEAQSHHNERDEGSNIISR